LPLDDGGGVEGGGGGGTAGGVGGVGQLPQALATVNKRRLSAKKRTALDAMVYALYV